MDHRFEIYPKIILANTTARITIKSLTNDIVLNDDNEYRIKYFPYQRESIFGSYSYQQEIAVKPMNGIISFIQFFNGEQEHQIVLQDVKNKTDFHFNFYSVYEDLFSRNPYKGDMHMHSNRSDGLEAPEFVTAMCRKIGLDFMALTDHLYYAPSIEAQEFFKDVKVDMLIARGEEVHAENNHVHIINYGGDFSVNDFIKNNRELYYQEVNDIALTLRELKDEHARFETASSIWVFNKIREANGLSIFCHPYWLIPEGYYIPEEVITYMYNHQPYDANEVIGGYRPYEEDSNTLQAARYYEETNKGKKIPIVGVSDAHGCFNQLFGWFYTIIFAKSNSREDIKESIKNYYSVAVENIPNEAVRPIGPFRLVKYSLYLAREYFPLHDKICEKEGQLMLDFIHGDQSVIEKMKRYHGQVELLIKKIFNRK